jgi:hypothetical protein
MENCYFFKVKEMMKKDVVSIMKICVLVLLVILLCYVPGCKKSSSEEGAGSSAQASVGDSSAAKTDTAKNTTIEKSTASAEMVPIEINLPKPMFVGTPQSTSVPNLEKPLGKPRPPFLAPVGTTNVALGKPVSSSDEEPIIGDIEMITDGDKEAADGSYVELGPFTQHVTVDLEAMHEIYAIVMWHYHKQARVYFDVVVQVADDPDFITNVRTLFNNDTDNSAGLGVGTDMHYTETNEGKLIDAKGVRARYVRLYSNGNTGNDLNHYIEVAVYGKPVE